MVRGDVVQKAIRVILLTAATLAVTFQLAPYIQPSFFSLFIASVAFCSWRWGPAYGILGNALSTLAVLYFFIPPDNSFAIPDSNALGRIILFICNNLFLTWILNEVRTSQRRSEEDRTHTRVLLERLLEKLAKGQPVTHDDLGPDKR